MLLWLSGICTDFMHIKNGSHMYTQVHFFKVHGMFWDLPHIIIFYSYTSVLVDLIQNITLHTIHENGIWSVNNMINGDCLKWLAVLNFLNNSPANFSAMFLEWFSIMPRISSGVKVVSLSCL